MHDQGWKSWNVEHRGGDLAPHHPSARVLAKIKCYRNIQELRQSLQPIPKLFVYYCALQHDAKNLGEVL